MAKHPFQSPSVRAGAALFLFMGVLTGCAFMARELMIVSMKVNAQFSAKQIEIEINKSFIEKYKDRVTITATFTVDKAMQNPTARMFDGDLHMAGRAPEIALPVVAEIANAASEKEATVLVHSVEGTRKPLKITGAWRVWPEHAGSEEAKQGTPLAPAESQNPGHVFEIHPITRINNIDLRHTLVPVVGFMPGDARATFEIYEKTECNLTARPKTISIVTRKGLYNDVEFIMEIAEDRQVEVPGGRFVMASVRDLKGNLLVEKLRMVFVTGTPPERAVRLLKRGDRVDVFGLPRVDLAEVSRRVRGGQADPSLLVKHLPYEIIILGFFKDTK